MAAGGSQRLLITILGINPRQATYELGGKRLSTKIATIALYELLPHDRKPSKVLALCTEEAHSTSYSTLEEELSGKLQLTPCQLDQEATNDWRRFLQVLAQAISQENPQSILLDITHGFRHLPFLTYLGALYLADLQGYEIEGAYYGLLREEPQVSPLLDLKPLMDLPQWIYAVRIFNETGDARRLVGLVERLSPTQTQQARRAMEEASSSYLAGLPLELGEAASRALQHLKPVRKALAVSGIPLSERLIDKLRETLSKFQLAGAAAAAGASGSGNWKRNIPLDVAELNRQRRFIDELWERGHRVPALGLMREWLVSWAVLVRVGGKNWLDRQTRTQAEEVLHALRERQQDSQLRNSLTTLQSELASLWELVTDVRNAYAHQGMRPEDLKDSTLQHKLEKAQQAWQSWMDQLPRVEEGAAVLALNRPEAPVWLVSPLGITPGVIYSAIGAVRQRTHAAPGACLVFTSKDGEALLKDAFAAADFTGEHKVLCFQDPFGGWAEMEPLVREAVRELERARQVFVNVTGGTTLMGLTVERVASALRRLGVPVQQFALVDRRPAEQQKRDPWQQGEVIWLDEQQGDANDA